ncbi:hypothetical protein H6P81_020305 [Aristolochia fimbriata]|uniref:Uncharacterized protein n=1 Tax=Aristolochia fimbriata TaxID=158543 RepID=A0AAV7DVY7_ARIFI|nr:hypothetical protein H6P81_020305 [Aristolochia fimbriata]
MEGEGGSSSSRTGKAIAAGSEASLWSRGRKKCASVFASLEESLQYLKASVIGLVKRAKARDEKEASRAEMEAEKMQVEAANAAEEKKNQLGMY